MSRRERSNRLAVFERLRSRGRTDRSDSAVRLHLSRIRKAKVRYTLAARGAVDGLWDWDLVSGSVSFSRRWKAMLGFDSDEIGVEPSEWMDRVHAEDLDLLKQTLELHLDGDTPHFEAEYRMQQHDGSYRWMYARGIAMRDQDGRPIRIAGSQTDIQERKLAVEELMKTAFHDGLTGLPNRLLFMDRLAQVLSRAKRGDGFAFAVMFLDLDRFKVINDTLGHQAGDKLLIEVSRRLETCIRPGDTIARAGWSAGDTGTVARLGGDEFTIILEGITHDRDAIAIAERIEESVAKPFEINGRETFTSVSIGIAVSRTGYESPDDLIRDADTAMYRAKKMGRNRYEVCDTAMHQSILRTVKLESELREAIKREEFLVCYQPIIDLESGRIAGFEGLLRWSHPTRGIVSPGEFIELAEESGSIKDIGAWVFRRVCDDLSQWNGSGNHAWVSVNVSARELVLGGFVESVVRQIVHSGVDPKRLKIEVTESAIVSNVDLARRALEMVRDYGIGICIDDFGTGYSSFSNLVTYPVDTLKIDQSFVSGMQPGNANWNLVGSMVPLAEILGKTSVAEGVETAAQLSRLRELGCTYGQGYYFSRAVSFDEASDLVEQNPSW